MRYAFDSDMARTIFSPEARSRASWVDSSPASNWPPRFCQVPATMTLSILARLVWNTTLLTASCTGCIFRSLARITGVRKQLSQAFGFVVPQFRVRDALEMAPNDYRIVLGGGLVEAMPKLYLPKVAESARRRVMRSYRDTYTIAVARLGDDAAIRGAAAWASQVST